MKKIIILFMTVCALVCALSFSASAAEENYTHKWVARNINSDEWQTFDEYDVTFPLSYKLEVEGGGTYTGEYINIHFVKPVTTGVNTTVAINQFFKGTVSTENAFVASWRFRYTSYYTPDENYTLYTTKPTDEQIQYLSQWFTLVEANVLCDGSICPVADFDIDGVCDTCGSTLAYTVQRSYAPEQWDSTYPLPPVGSNAESQYIILNTGGNTILYVLAPKDGNVPAEWNTTGTAIGSMCVETFDASGNKVYVDRYSYYYTNGEWAYRDKQTVSSTIFGDFDEIEPVYSTLSFYRYDGSLFFPLPLWVQVEQVTQGVTAHKLQTLGGTIQILVLCGVGLMACLVVLSLFGKRSLIFRR